MRNSEVYAYIERMFDVISSGLPDGDVISEVQDILAEFGEEVTNEAKKELNRKYGFDSTPFFSEIAESDDEEIMNFCERMDEVHPRLGKFMQYLMEEDDPTFFICYGEDDPNLIGRSSDMWAFKSATLIRNRLLRGGSLNDK